MQRLVTGILVLGAAAALAAAATTAGAAGAKTRARCSGMTSLRTLTTRPRSRVDFRERRTTIHALGMRERPARVVHGATAFERQTFVVVAQIVLARRTANNSIQIVLFDDGAYMNAVLPPLQCLTARTPGRARIAGARYRYAGACGIPGLEWEPLGAVAYVSGVGFWGPLHGRGAAPNGAELAPVTGVRLLAGCGVQ